MPRYCHVTDRNRLPALLVFTDSGPEGFVYSTTIGAHGNVLDVAVRRSDGSILVSVDPESTGYEVSKLGDCGVLIDEVIPEPGNPDRVSITF